MSFGAILGGLGAALSGGASLASMFGSKQKKGLGPEGQINWGYKNFMKQIQAVRDAGAAYGFHPLALLGAGGSGGFAQPVSGFDSPWIGDAVGAAGRSLADIGELYQSDEDRIERAQARSDYNDQIERQRMDQIAADTIASGERDKQQLAREAEIRRLDSETLLNAARTRTEIQQLRNGALGGVTNPPTSINNPYTGTWRLAPGTSSANDAQNIMGEPFEWMTSIEQLIYNLLHDPDSSRIILPGGSGGVTGKVPMHKGY